MFNHQRLKQLRKDLKLSQHDMASRLDMEQSTYNRYETNKAQPGFHVLEKIQKEFKVEPTEFFSGDNNVTFETGSTNNGNGINVVNAENFY